MCLGCLPGELQVSKEHHGPGARSAASDAWVWVLTRKDNATMRGPEAWGLAPPTQGQAPGTLGMKWGPLEVSDPSRALSFLFFPS